MHLVSAFRRLPCVDSPVARAVPIPAATVANPLQVDQFARPGDERDARPVLVCRWEVAEEPFVQLGDQTFRSGALFLHWKPVP